MRDRKRRQVRPAVERCESRELLSGITVVLNRLTPNYSAQTQLLRNLATNPSVATTLNPAAATTSGVSAANTDGGTTIPKGNGLTGNTVSPLLGSGTPTPHELLRDQFRASFSGPVYTSPGRFSDQGLTYFYRGLGGSSFFLHGDFTMAIITPTAPGGKFIGEAVLNDKNANTGAVLGLTLVGNTTDVDSRGRPIHMTFTSDPSIYGGTFFASASQGTVDIKYGPNNTARAVFNGLVYTTGLTNPLTNLDLYARHGRPLKQHGPAALNRVK